MIQKSIPVLRMFDVPKAKAFYVDWLGFEIMWEHQFEPDMPYYIGIKRDGVEIHLSEHHGDSTPGTHVFIVCTELHRYLEELQSRPYKYYRPAIERTFYEAWCMTVQDPSGNRLKFNEYIVKA